MATSEQTANGLDNSPKGKKRWGLEGAKWGCDGLLSNGSFPARGGPFEVSIDFSDTTGRRPSPGNRRGARSCRGWLSGKAPRMADISRRQEFGLIEAERVYAYTAPRVEKGKIGLIFLRGGCF